MALTPNNNLTDHYPIGDPGKAWGDHEKSLWLERQEVKRSYYNEVLSKLDKLKHDAVFNEQFNMTLYGSLPYDSERYPLVAIKSTNWDDNKPSVLVTGGVHGYETSGVQGAIRFAQTKIHSYCEHFNFVVVPCISPWGYETINRWNPLTLDPNRSFYKDSPAPEVSQIMAFVKSLDIEFLAHFDLHETTDTDNSEFRPALAARDGVEHDQWDIPDGFYVVGDSAKPTPDFQKAVITSVEKITHIAPHDGDNKLIGATVEQNGVINYDKKNLNLCGGMTSSRYVTTTEVYPDSDQVDDENCILAQVAAITGGLDYIIAEEMR